MPDVSPNDQLLSDLLWLYLLMLTVPCGVLCSFYRRNYNIFFLSSRMTNCSSSHSTTYGTSFTCDHLRFGWMLFLALSKHILTQFDLVTCTNGLIAIIVSLCILTYSELCSFIHAFSIALVMGLPVFCVVVSGSCFGKFGGFPKEYGISNEMLMF